MTRGRKRFALVLRSLVVLLLLLAIAGWQAVRPNRGVTTIFLLDISDSVPEEGRRMGERYIRDSLKAAGTEDKSGLIVFGRDALIDQAPTISRTLSTIYSAPDRQGTDIGSAIRLATALFPDGSSRRIVLLSDGNETEGDAVQSATVALADNIEIDTAQLSSASLKNETLITEVLTPNEVKIGEPFNMRVVIQSSSVATGMLRVDRDGLPVKSVSVSLSPGKNVVVVPIQTEKSGFYRYRAILESDPDVDPRNNVGRSFVSIRGKPRVLLAQGTPDPTHTLEKALRRNNVDVVTAGPNQLPTRADEFQNFDSIIFNDMPAFQLSPQQMQVIQSAVRDTGIGFAMVGGENSFLPGGYFETPIAELLPVDLEVRQRRVYPAATVIIIIDISGSMGMPEDGIEKVYIAAKAAITALKMLRPNDRFGVIVSGEGVEWLAKVQSAGNRSEVIDQIMKIYAGGGGIYVRSSLEFANDAFKGENSRVKHLILLADGGDCDMQEGCYDLAKKLLAQRVTLTAVAMGGGGDVPFLKTLSRIGQGNFYLTERARDLPKLFTADVSLMTRSAIEEGAFIPKVASGDEMLRGIDWSKTPVLLAYNLTSDKPLARTLMRTQKDDPLLATWQYGLGTSLAFTSDAQPKWAQRWVAWPQFDAFWSQVLRSTLRKSGKLNYAVETRREGGQVVMEMQAFDAQGNPVNFLQPEVKVSEPNGKILNLILQQESPGRYNGRFDLSGIGDYLLTVTERDPNGSVRVSTSGFAVPYPPEYLFTRANPSLLKRISELSGGRFNPKPTDLFRRSTRSGVSVTDLWPLSLWLSLFLFLLDVTTRRVALPISEVVVALLGFFKRLRRSTPHPQVQISERLLSVKGRTRTQTQTEEVIIPKSDSPKPEEKQPAPVVPDKTDITSRLLESKRKRRE
jgi:uncharacterized membrane protein